ncbi:MAG: DUF1697 domain-containing protein [Anaerolineae bacterium]|nr:DUF1697 domain-containing protein [Anaerolineae bacterium]
MTPHVAFLRAINVGGHTVKMDHLRRLFEDLGLTHVSTFIASGNVLFDPPDEEPAALEARIERHLESALGYAVKTFIRPAAALPGIASTALAAAPHYTAETDALHIGFLNALPTESAWEKLLALQTADDRFYLGERELFWWRHGRVSDSPLSGNVIEKTLGLPTTLRSITTLQKLAAKSV